MPDRKTIRLKNYLNIIEEIDAGGTVTPGMLLLLNSSDNVVAHNAAGQNASPRMFALEDELQGNDIDDNYSTDDKVQVWFPQPGDMVYAILADGENVSIGDELESNGAGYLQAHTADVESFESAEAGSITVYPEQIIGIAREAVDLSDSSGAESSGTLGYNKRIKITIV